MDKYEGRKPPVRKNDYGEDLWEVEKIVGGQSKGDIFRAEVNLSVPHELIRVEKTATDLYKAIDKVKDHLDEMIVKYREKARDKRRGK